MTITTNESPDTGETFKANDFVHTVVGYYTGTKNYSEMFTHTPTENGLTQYHRWARYGFGLWNYMDSSTLTELDLVCDMFHKVKRFQ